MVQSNKIEIRGIIGSVRVQNVGNTRVANLSVATDYCYTSRDGSSVIETTWHYITVWEGRDIQPLEQLKKGSFIHVIGRIRNWKYTTPDGIERIAYDIVANKVELIERPSARV